MDAAHLPNAQYRRSRRLAGWVAACALSASAAAAPDAWAQLPPSRFLEPHYSSFRPVAGERNPFLPVEKEAVTGVSRERGKLAAGSSTTSEQGGMIGAGLPERFRPASATAQEAVPKESVAPYKVSEESFRLSGILLDSRDPLAVINGQSCGIGDKVMLNAGAGIILEFSVAEIKDREVRLTCQEVEVTLRLKGKSGVVE